MPSSKKSDEPEKSSILREGSKILMQAGIMSAATDARVMLSHILDTDARILNYDAKITPSARKKFMDSINRRATGEPVAYITGKKEFWRHMFKVGTETLVPRPDSETLVEAVLEKFSDREAAHNILDLGTGTGCLLLSLISEYENARGTGIDLSAAAIKVAKSNARNLGLSDRAKFICKSWLDDTGPGGKFNMVISNPPYVKTADLDTLDTARHEPKIALSGGADGLGCYREIAAALKRWNILAPGACLLFEIGKDQADAVEKILAETGFGLASSHKDLGGIIRVLEFLN